MGSVAADLARRGGRGLGVEIGYVNLRAVPCEQPRGRAADARAGTRDDRDFAGRSMSLAMATLLDSGRLRWSGVDLEEAGRHLDGQGEVGGVVGAQADQAGTVVFA